MPIGVGVAVSPVFGTTTGSAAPGVPSALLMEDGFYLLLESGDKLLLE